jgi:diacylglycerol O-acyltransferase
VNYSPISIPIDGLGLNVTSFSYNGTMWICAVSCREMMPDPAFFAQCLRAAFEELKAAAARHAAEEAEVLTVAATAPRTPRAAKAPKAAKRAVPRKRAARRRAGARA